MEPDAAAIREAREETGLVVEVEGLVSALTMVWDDAPMLYLVFTARYVSGEPVADGKEMDAAAFYGLDALDGEQPSAVLEALVSREEETGRGVTLCLSLLSGGPLSVAQARMARGRAVHAEDGESL